jgi:predicted O-linked N-acetylglucosamine transferase (SPINDLY family)
VPSAGADGGRRTADEDEALARDGASLADQGDPAGAAAHFGALADADPDDACALSNLASQLLELGPAHQDEALRLLRRAAELAPRWAHPHYGLGLALQRAGDEAAAAEAYGRAWHLDPDHAGALASLLTMSRLLCQWEHLGELERRARRFLHGPEREPPAVLTPLASLGLPTTPREQYEAARRWSRTVGAEGWGTGSPGNHGPLPGRRGGRAHASSPASTSVSHTAGQPLRLGYLSADLFPGCHPVARSLVEVIERHDRRRVHVTVYSLSWSHPDDDRDAGRRIRQAADAVVDLSRLSAEEAARRIATDGTDVLVDLGGHTHGCRPHILAQLRGQGAGGRRQVPVIVNYLGYPGTCGGHWWDYAVADRFLVPPSAARWWSERLSYLGCRPKGGLPGCFMPSDSSRQASVVSRQQVRTEWGLPQRGTVFCCFNHNVKINPAVFRVWMRVLAQVRGSVLWLFSGHPCVPAALRRAAETRGVDPQRLHFAQKQEHADYLAAMGAADLFLDTWPYGAGATANDALWAGLPVLTLAGPTYVGRMAASQCRSVGMGDLVASSVAQYERWAVEIGQARDAQTELRQRLAHNRGCWPLFDMSAYVRSLEAAFARMAAA